MRQAGDSLARARTLFTGWFSVAGLVLALLPCAAQDELFAPPNDVSLSISTERHPHRVGEPIVIKYRIVNISHQRLFVPQGWELKCPPSPHVWAWFENSEGKHFVPGYAGDCSPESVPKTVTSRMAKEAVLLRPMQYLNGSITLATTLFGGLKPGAYRIEAVLYGWREQDFDEAERSRLASMGAPFVRGDVPTSISIRLIP